MGYFDEELIANNEGFHIGHVTRIESTSIDYETVINEYDPGSIQYYEAYFELAVQGAIDENWIVPENINWESVRFERRKREFQAMRDELI